MDDPPDTPAETDDASGRAPGTGVDVPSNDAFSSAFLNFASGGKPDPEPEPEGDDDDAGQDGAEERGDKPPSDGDANGRKDEAPGDKPAAGTEPDPWANATPAQIAARDKMQAELDQVRRQAVGASGRASGLQRRLNELQQGTAAQPPKPEPEQAGKKPGDAWQALEDKIKALKEDYPEIAGPVIGLLEAQRDEMAALRGSMTPIIESSREEAVVAAQAQVEARHQDWRSYGNPSDPNYAAWLTKQDATVREANAAFTGWLASQPPKVQALADSWDPAEASVALTLFKTERAEAMRGRRDDPPPPKDTATDAKRQRQLDGGKVVGSRPGSAASGAPDDFEGAFGHFAARQEPQRKA